MLYIEHWFDIKSLKGELCLCLPLVTWLQWLHFVQLSIVLVISMDSMIPRRKNNRPLAWETESGYFLITWYIRRTVIGSTFFYNYNIIKPLSCQISILSELPLNFFVKNFSFFFYRLSKFGLKVLIQVYNIEK